MRVRNGMLLIAAATFVVGCGGDDGGADEPPASTTTAPAGSTTAAPASSAGGETSAPDTAAADGEPIVIGGIADATTFIGTDDGARARFDRANREGGVAGRPIEYVGAEDVAAVEANALSAVRALVQNDHVDAVVPIASTAFTPGVSDFLVQSEVPYIGWGFMPGFCGSEFGYGVNGCLINPEVVNSALVEPSLAELGKDPATVRAAIQGNDNLTGNSNALYASLLEAQGAEVVYDESNLGVGVTDYTPYVQAILASEPDLVIVATQFQDAVALTGALTAAGFEGLLLNYIAYAPGLLEAQPAMAAALDGSYAMTQFPPQEAGGPAVEQMLADLQASGLPEFVTIGAAVGYWSADLYLQMLEAAGGDPAAVASTVNGGFTYTGPEGGLGEMAWPELQEVALPCQAMMKVEDGAYVVAKPFACYENVPIG